MTNIISEMAVFHANRSMKTNFARKFVIFHWVKQQKTISSPNVDTINICPGARRKISYVTWETIKSSIECLFCLFCWVKFVFWSVENSPKLPLGQLKVLHAKHFFLNLHKCHPKMFSRMYVLISVANVWFPRYLEHRLSYVSILHGIDLPGWAVASTNVCLISHQRQSTDSCYIIFTLTIILGFYHF